MSCFDFEVRRKSAQAKLKLLAYGVRDNLTLFESTSSFKEEHYAYDNGNWGVDQGRRIPSEIMLDGGVVSKVHVRPSSPITLRAIDGRIGVELNGMIICFADFLPRPTFWDYCTEGGIPTKQLAHFYGANCLNFNIYSGCEFYDVGKPCQFCSVIPTQKKHHGVVVKKLPEELASMCALAVSHDPVDWILVTGGSYQDGDVEFSRHMDVVRAIRKHLPWNGRFKGNLSLMPPKNLSLLRELYELGVDHPSFNLEVWPKESFARICPGKMEYVGFDHILSAYECLVELYGSGEVWCNFVAGLTPIDDLHAGFKEMASRGVVPGANVYHPEVGTKLGTTMSSPGEDYIKRVYCYVAELYHEYGFKPYFSASVLRNSLANEAYEGLL